MMQMCFIVSGIKTFNLMIDQMIKQYHPWLLP